MENLIDNENGRIKDPERINAINLMWQSFKPYANKSFKKTFNNDPQKQDSLLWELQLGYDLIQKGYNLEKIASEDAPDIAIKDKNNKIVWIECVLPQDDTKERSIKTNDFIEVDNEKQTLQITSVLLDKLKQYNCRINKQKVCSKSPYIIAINGHLLNKKLDEIFEVLTPLGGFAWCFNNKTKEITEAPYIQKEIIKKSNAKVDTAILDDEKYNAFSGIIFSNKAIGHVTTEQFDYIFIPNPNAINPCNVDFLKLAKIFEYENNKETFSIRELAENA